MRIGRQLSPWQGGASTTPEPPLFTARRTMKLNNILTYLGDNAAENAHLQQCVDWHVNAVQFYGLSGLDFSDPSETDMLAAFIAKAYNNYDMIAVGGIRDSMTGFQEMLDFNSAYAIDEQFIDFNMENEFWFGEKVTFRITSAVNGMTYKVTLDGVDYTHVGTGLDTAATISAAIYALIPTSPSPGITWTKSVTNATTFQIFADSVNTPFTHATTGNISTAIINFSRAEWLDQMDTLKAALVLTGMPWETSAYVQNYSGDPRWDLADAVRMIQSIDVYEGTNYTIVPDWERLIESQLYLLANALAANPGFKTKQRFQKLFSAEPIYLHNYLSANGINSTETTWDAGYTAFGTTAPYGNADKMYNLGTNYFAYNQMAAAPAIAW